MMFIDVILLVLVIVSRLLLVVVMYIIIILDPLTLFICQAVIFSTTTIK